MIYPNMISRKVTKNAAAAYWPLSVGSYPATIADAMQLTIPPPTIATMPMKILADTGVGSGRGGGLSGTGKAAPHWKQLDLPNSFSVPHCGQVTPVTFAILQTSSILIVSCVG
jgi:hypothetical protein